MDSLSEIISVINEAKMQNKEDDILEYIKKHYPQFYEICKLIFNKNPDIVSTTVKYLDIYSNKNYSSEIREVDETHFLNPDKNPYLFNG